MPSTAVSRSGNGRCCVAVDCKILSTDTRRRNGGGGGDGEGRVVASNYSWLDNRTIHQPEVFTSTPTFAFNIESLAKNCQEFSRAYRARSHRGHPGCNVLGTLNLKGAGWGPAKLSAPFIFSETFYGATWLTKM